MDKSFIKTEKRKQIEKLLETVSTILKEVKRELEELILIN